MSDSKKPKLSEIKARRKHTDIIYESRAKFPHLLPGPSQMDKDNEYLLGLVERMGRIIRDDVNPISEIDTIRVRALLEEVKL